MRRTNQELWDEAQARDAMHKNDPKHYEIFPDHDYVGLIVERAVSDLLGQPVDMTRRRSGDGGIDFNVNTMHGQFTLNAKGAKKAYELIVKVEDIKPRVIYMLGEVLNQDRPYLEWEGRVVGWEWGSELMKSRPKTHGYKFLNYWAPAKLLRKADELLAVLI